jgi:hypothetical protein
MEPEYEQLRMFPPLPDEARMTRQELAHLLTREGIATSALTRFCLSPDGAQFNVRLPQATAGAVWERARDRVQATGYWPVLTLGHAAMGWTEAETAAEAALLAGRSAPAVVTRALRLDVQAWLAARQALYGRDEDDPGYAEELAGTWPPVSQRGWSCDWSRRASRGRPQPSSPTGGAAGWTRTSEAELQVAYPWRRLGTESTPGRCPHRTGTCVTSAGDRLDSQGWPYG